MAFISAGGDPCDKETAELDRLYEQRCKEYIADAYDDKDMMVEAFEEWHFHTNHEQRFKDWLIDYFEQAATDNVVYPTKDDL